MSGVQSDDLLLRAEGIDKSYPGVHALKQVGFELRPGEVHALLGENGAGKSTFIKILSGAESPDAGHISISGEPVHIDNPLKARSLGIFTIYQELSLVPQLTVAENICLGTFPSSWGWADWNQAQDTARTAIERLNIRGISTGTTVGELSVHEQQLVEIARALTMETRILILDEPTSALTAEETVVLFDLLRDLVAQGVGIIYISHRLEEVTQIGDRATILRDGQVTGTVRLAETSRDELVTMIVGKEIKERFPKTEVEKGKLLLKVKGDGHPAAKFSDVGFELYEGEVLGMAGLLGSGSKEFVRGILGIDADIPAVELELNGKRKKIRSPADAIRAGIYYLPSDRKREGVVMPLSVADNIVLSVFKRYVVGGFLSYARVDADCRVLRDQLNIKTPSLATIVEYLSGGNQQKVLIARALCAQSRVFIFDEPTRGIDVGSKVEIYTLINGLLEQGAGVILSSPELPELVGMCDRILAWRDGKIIAELHRQEAREERLLHLISA